MIRIVKFYYFFDEEDKKALMDLLKANELSCEDFAKKIGISPAYFSLILNGKRAVPEDLHAFYRQNIFPHYKERGVLKWVNQLLL